MLGHMIVTSCRYCLMKRIFDKYGLLALLFMSNINFIDQSSMRALSLSPSPPQSSIPTTHYVSFPAGPWYRLFDFVPFFAVIYWVWTPHRWESTGIPLPNEQTAIRQGRLGKGLQDNALGTSDDFYSSSPYFIGNLGLGLWIAIILYNIFLV